MSSTTSSRGSGTAGAHDGTVTPAEQGGAESASAAEQ